MVYLGDIYAEGVFTVKGRDNDAKNDMAAALYDKARELSVKDIEFDKNKFALYKEAYDKLEQDPLKESLAKIRSEEGLRKTLLERATGMQMGKSF